MGAIALLVGSCGVGEVASSVQVWEVPASAETQEEIGVSAWKLVSWDGAQIEVIGLDAEGHKRGHATFGLTAPGESGRVLIRFNGMEVSAARDGESLANTMRATAEPWMAAAGRDIGSAPQVYASADCNIKTAKAFLTCVMAAVPCALMETGIGAVVCVGAILQCGLELADAAETCTAPYNTSSADEEDTDMDGVVNVVDRDDDNDGVPDSEDGDDDNDGLPDPENPDETDDGGDDDGGDDGSTDDGSTDDGSTDDGSTDDGGGDDGGGGDF